MSTPNPLIPQGSLQNKGTSNVRIAVATIVAIHIVFFGGLLLQGCKRDPKPAVDTNAPASGTNLNSTYTLPPMTNTDLYYTSPSNLPPDRAEVAAATSAQPASNWNDYATSRSNTDFSTPGGFTSPGTSTATTPYFGGTEPAGTAEGKEYTIVRGDTLSKVARDNGTTVSAITRANPGVDPSRLRIGAKIKIPAPSPRASASETTAGTGASGNVYVVKSGDNLTRIARAHGTTVSALRAANNLRVSQLKVGQKLRIPASASSAPVTNTARTGNTLQ